MSTSYTLLKDADGSELSVVEASSKMFFCIDNSMIITRRYTSEEIRKITKELIRAGSYLEEASEFIEKLIVEISDDYWLSELFAECQQRGITCSGKSRIPPPGCHN